MRNLAAITQKELKSFFASPIAYVVSAAFLAVAGFLFVMILFITREASLRYLFGNLVVILFFIAPAISMRLLSEEFRSGSIELLMTSPVHDWEVVWGKWFAALGLFLAMVALTLFYPLVLKLLGNPDWGPIISGYIGLILMGSTMLALGELTSSMTSNQIVAAILAVVFILILWLLDALAQYTTPAIGSVFTNMALSSHYSDFMKGVIDTKDVIYFLSVIVGSLFLATQILQSRRWR